MTYIYALLIGFLGGFLRRCMGGAIKAPKVITVGALSFLAAALCGGTFLAQALVAVFTAIYWAMGHGSYMDMGTQDKPDNERFKRILDWFFGAETKPSISRDFYGMVLRYTVPAVPVAVIFVLAGNSAVVWFPIVGVLIASAYLIFSLNSDDLKHTKVWFDGFTSYGEWAAGFIFYGLLFHLSAK